MLAALRLQLGRHFAKPRDLTRVVFPPNRALGIVGCLFKNLATARTEAS
jgi:hypothetical protein